MNLSPGITPTDGIGELWFRNESDMLAALQSPQFASAIQDAARFLDLSKTYAIVVREVFEIGPVGPFCRGDDSGN